MAAPIMFNRRLSKNELEIWMELIKNQTEFGYLNREQASSFLNLEDTISFVSSVEDEIIGGTVIYRDRTRLGMILASVVTKNEFRETVAYSIIKSSLPFFKTVAIRDVDALVPNEPIQKRLGFPGTLELDYWTREVLERIGFEEQNKLWNYTISINADKLGNERDKIWDPQPNLEEARNLIWDSGKAIGMTNSFIWAAFDFAASQGKLRTITLKDSTKLVTSICLFNRTAIISLLISDEEITTAPKLIARMVRESVVDNVVLPLVGKGQSNLIEAVSDELGGALKRRSMTLMRRNL
ncbi:MAG: hypothetical protein E4H14_12570 [Candidatus Thorarchaeota archaeon]|nr:MAG: hypothetical protein E4H14_12570 [Candidatus Thorarchaeota archaeon]